MLRYQLLFLVILSACTSKPKVHTAADVEAAMRKYDRLIQTMNADSIANMYAEDGDLGVIAHGRDSIKVFLGTFGNVEVIQTTSTTDQVTIAGDSAVQTGSYVQIDRIDKKDTVVVRGTYRANWRWTNKEGWKIKLMETTPM